VPVFGPITTDRRVRRFGVFDLEWVPGEQLPLPENLDVEIAGLRDGCRIPLPPRKVMTSPLQLRMGGYYDQQVVGSDEGGDEVERVERYQSFSTVRELIDFMLCRDHRGMWFFAHAGGLADMQFVLDELLTEIKRMSGVGRTSVVVAPDGTRKTEEHVGSEWKIRASFSGSSAIIVHVAKGKNAWHFCDSYWLLRDKLASIGKAIGIRKGDSDEAKAWMSERFGREITDFEQLSQLEKVVFYRDVPTPILTGYNRTDCEILWKAIFQFEEEILGLGGQLQQTIASTAMTLFRRSYLQQEIYTSEKLNQVAQESYFASRVEVLSRNVTDFLMYDINSSFPYAMTFPLPGNLTGFQTTLPDDDRDECLYVANVTLEVPETHMPPLPFRRDGRVFFPVGRWRAWLTSTDIRLALREGATLHKVHEVYTFEPFWDFRAYAEEIYARRVASETPFRKLVLKYLLNSLYGKAAEGIVKQEMLINPDEVDREKMQMLQPGVWLQEKEAVIAHRHVVISSFITAIARRTLFDFAKECYRQGKPLTYCDTDSLATRADLPVDDKKLGGLKLEKKMDWAEFVAPKIYLGEGYELNKDGTWSPKRLNKAKGFSLGSGKAAFDKLNRIVGGERVGIQRMTRLRELYRTQVDGQYVTAPFEMMVIKALTFETLCKRFHYPDGETRPWSIEELKSGDCYPRGFDFDEDSWARVDDGMRAAMMKTVRKT
jgi:hypothetical protein